MELWLKFLSMVLMSGGLIIAFLSLDELHNGGRNIIPWVIATTVIDVIAICLIREPFFARYVFIGEIVMTLAVYLIIIVVLIVTIVTLITTKNKMYDDKEDIRDGLLPLFLVIVSGVIILTFGIVHLNNVDKNCLAQLENSENIVDFDVDGSHMTVVYYNKQGKKTTSDLRIKTIETEDENLVSKYDFSSISKDRCVKYYKEVQSEPNISDLLVK
jgi:hypothetical protein